MFENRNTTEMWVNILDDAPPIILQLGPFSFLEDHTYTISLIGMNDNDLGFRNKGRHIWKIEELNLTYTGPFLNVTFRPGEGIPLI